MTALVWLCIAAVLAPPTLVVEPETTSLAVGDPLVVKATLRNTTPMAITLARPFDAGWTGVVFDIHGPGETEFRRASIWNQGLKCGSAHPRVVAPGDRLVSYETTDLSREGGDYSRRGVWRLRAVSTVNGLRVESGVVEITVRKRRAEGERALAESAHLVHEVGRWSASAAAAKMAGIEAHVAGSNAAVALARARHLNALRHAATLRSKQDALAALRTFREDLPPVTREFLDLQTCEVLVTRHELDAAGALLKTITEPSRMREGVAYSLEAARVNGRR